MTVKRLGSSYWYAKINDQRFAQWPIGDVCTREHTFGWAWSDAELEQANELALKQTRATPHKERKP